jgi:hypothetical protein
VQANEARRGTVVRVREVHWKGHLAGVISTVQNCWGNPEHAAVDVLLEDGSSELYWLPDRLWWTKTSPSSPLFSLSVVMHRSINEHSGFWLPFGYYLERDADLLTLRRSDHSFVAAFIPWVLDLLEVEFVAWEDAD